MTQVAVQGQIWNFTEISEGQCNPILILHGWGRSSNEWIELAKAMGRSKSRKVYVVDLPGFGGSNIPKVESIFEYSELVVQFCKYLKIEKLTVIGHSLGGRVAIVLASKYREMIEQVVLIDPAGVKQISFKRSILKLLAQIFAFVPRSVRSKLASPMMDSDYRNSPKLRELYRAVVKDDLRKNLRQIQCPTLLMWGENDKVLPVTLTKIYRKYLTDVTVKIVWGAGHDPHLSHFDQSKTILQENVL